MSCAHVFARGDRVKHNKKAQENEVQGQQYATPVCCRRPANGGDHSGLVELRQQRVDFVLTVTQTI
jgi:hypothetical protein